jgi:outer membrane lipoprotein SlyB
MNITNKFSAALFALAALLPMSFLPDASHAQSSVAAPKIDGFDVEPAQQLIPGSDLLFTLYGSPGGSARVRISGATVTVPLEETEAGVYEGAYTIKLRDKITASSTATANLRLGNRVASALLDEPLVAGARVTPQAVMAQPASGAYPPRIERFGVDPGNRLVPGEDLIFTLIGSPGGEASVRVAGVQGKIDLHEAAPGRYEGGYVIKNRDRIAENAAVTASLRVGGQTTTAALGQSLVASAGAAPRAGRGPRFCANCGVVEAINPIEVEGKGSFLGTIVGGVAGGLLGSQIGSGRGTTAAEIAGAVGGAFAGNEIEKRVKKTQHFEVVVRLENGGTQTIAYSTPPGMRVGDRVRVENGALVPNA